MENMNKTKVDLITGFLGAGKTTFLKQYLNYCSLKNEKLIVIENEFGQEGVDKQFLQEVTTDVKELAGGCICCGLKVNFHDQLIALAKEYDRILVEPSGIYTIEDFFDIMESPSMQNVCEIGNILMIVDPIQLQQIDEEAEKVVYSQLASAGLVIVSKSTIHKMDSVVVQKRLQNILSDHHNENRNIKDYFLYKDWDLFADEDYERMMKCGYVRNQISLPKEDHSTIFFHTSFLDEFKDEEQMKEFIRKLMQGTFGDIIRIKGYLKTVQGEVLKINCTRTDLCVEKASDKNRMGINIIGKKIDRKAIKEWMNT